MKSTQKLHELGQSLWVDNITRQMLREDTLKGYIEELSVTGLTSNPTIFEKAIGSGEDYDQQISEVSGSADSSEGPGADSDENVFFELALADLRDAADLFADVHTRTGGVDGYVSLEVSPLLADDTGATIEQAAKLHAKAERENLFIKIPGTPAGLGAIEESIFAGIPINVTLLFDDQQYLAAADAYMKGIERRIEAGLDPVVQSVASIFMSRWDVAVAEEVPAELKNKLGIAIGGRAYHAYRELLDSDRWMRLANRGARAQRLLWASTGTKDPDAPDTLYIEAFASPFTVNTMPDKTLEAFGDHGELGDLMDPAGAGAELELKQFEDAGIDLAALAQRLQEEGKESFDKSWRELLKTIADKRGVTA
ncbi:MAG TPA: transaldolase [Solirubrobacterales bacterium]|jgi:transaldolase|nr:transaldolase [Solirubrobacterales bacterium]